MTVPFKNLLRWKLVLKLNILHSHLGYNIIAYHVETPYKWHDVTDRPPTEIGEPVTIIPFSKRV